MVGAWMMDMIDGGRVSLQHLMAYMRQIEGVIFVAGLIQRGMYVDVLFFVLRIA